MKICNIDINGNVCHYTLSGDISIKDMLDMVEYKAWEYRSWKYGKEKKNFTWIKNLSKKVLWSYIGFAPVMIRKLMKDGYRVYGVEEMMNVKDISVGGVYYDLWDFQRDAVDAWEREGRCGVIKSPSGSGKTVKGCEIISRVSQRTIICVPTTDLMINVWYKSLVEQFGMIVRGRIGIIGGRIKREDRIKMGVEVDSSYEKNIRKDIVISTLQSLMTRTDKLCNERFGMVVVDECHRVAANQFKKVINNISAMNRVGLSATLVRDDGMSPVIHALMGDIVYKVSVKELVKKKILVEPIFETVVLKDEEVEKNIGKIGEVITKGDALRYVRLLKRLSAMSEMKRNYILRLLVSLKANRKKFVVYTDFVNIKGVFTRDYYVKLLNEIGVRVIGVSSEFDASERERAFGLLERGKIDGLVFGRLGNEGINIPTVDSVVICNASKSGILYPQRVGRALRTVGNGSKRNAYIYEVLLDIDKEKEWSEHNFHEYIEEGYTKKYIVL